ncbi:QacE family quaternary ammonium compound efflux SMR transporter [Paraeggerthella hongkongensis]|uniref:DMT family transporter n=1 Tax=Paraeggerthella TaxID=651554 RepID=UPI000DF81ACD|nr:SMR family transporter [Paraeggerthella sp. Marseille-Q4926]RDB59127.1 QacE family quaternary ammonium compound efflux SMR transporter [Paraeggerthella hongkongensis]
MDRVHPYALLSVSIILEVFGTTMMKLSEGFSVPLFTALTLAGYLVSFTLLTFTLKHLPLGLVYGIWGGVGTVLTAAIGIIAWGDPFNVITCVGIALVVGGVVLLNQGTQELEDARKAAKDAQQA